jgi:hypothetical protein
MPVSEVLNNRIREIIYLPQREIKLEGAMNFRDLGGYPAYKGKETKWNKIFRAGDIYNTHSAGCKQGIDD